MYSLRPWLLFVACLLTLPIQAQQFIVKSITFTGYPAASQADLLAASGLKGPGAITQPEFQAAAQRLNDTGLFSHITYKFDGRDFSFELQPAPGLLPARFDNFAWLDPADIDRQLHAKIPLYHGKVIAGSGLEQQVTDALTAMAAEQHLTATITVVPVMSATPAEEFRLTTPKVVVSQLTFTGVSPDLLTRLDPVAKAAVGEDYSARITTQELTTAITSVYRNNGYLDVDVPSVAKETPTLAPDKISVPMKATIVEGAQYHLGKLTLDGSVLMSQEEFQKRALLKPGDIANQELLRRTLLTVSSPYRTKGYLRAKISAAPSLNPTTHIADYAIHVEPGDQWHMGKLELANVSDTQRAQFLSVWKMNAGDPYDASYPPSFLVKNHASLRAFDDYSASYKQYEHEDTHIVDLVVTFQHGGPLK
jgi:outer membrane protein insertion porin family